MNLSRADVRNSLKNEFLRVVSASEAVKIFNEAYGAKKVSKSVAYEWFSRFKLRELTIDDQKRCGRPKTVDNGVCVKKKFPLQKPHYRQFLVDNHIINIIDT